MPPGWARARGSEKARGAVRVPGHACSGHSAGASRPRLQRLPPGMVCSLHKAHPGPWAGVQARSSPSSCPHQGVLPGWGEHSHFFCTDVTPRPSTPGLEGSGGGDAPLSLRPQVKPTRLPLTPVGRPLLRLPAPRAYWQSCCDSARGGLTPAQKQGGTLAHADTDERQEDRGPQPWPAAPAARHPRE